MTKLTKPQRAMLERSLRDTHSDDSGVGAMIFDGYDRRIAERLKDLGFGRIGHALRGPYGAIKITPAGREALAATKRT